MESAPVLMMKPPVRMAFYDFDGTLASSNVVTRYAYYARKLPSRLRAAAKYTQLLVTVPLWIGLNLYSRRLFNEIFYRQYRGLERDWLRNLGEPLFEKVIRPTIFPGARALLEADRAAGFRLVMVSGGLDFALEPVVRYFSFDDVICNTLVYNQGAATGEISPPLIAEQEKVAAIIRLCREANAEVGDSKAYSDSSSDLPMLEAIGHPAAVHPDRRLRLTARKRGWPVLDLKRGDHVHRGEIDR